MKLNYKNTLLVGFVFFFISLFWQAYDAIIPKILTDKFGLSQGLSGIAMAIDNVLALFLLPFFGALSDKCTHPKGRRTPFIVVGTILAVTAFMGLAAVDNWQLTRVAEVAPTSPTAQEVLYDADLTVTTPDGESIRLQDAISREAFLAIEPADADGTRPEYTELVIPARQAYARAQTWKNPMILATFVAVLLALLISMASFRSPAVALMPDVTVKPLRSKANAMINLMGAAGGIVVLLMGVVFGTGKTPNALMGYAGYFATIAVIMLGALAVFLLKVNEPKLAAQMHEDSLKYGLSEDGDEETEASGNRKLSRAELKSLLLILASVFFWFMGFNAVMSKFSVYAGKILDMDYNLALTLASGAAIVAYAPLGILTEKLGRRKSILMGIVLLTVAFTTASFLRAGDSPLLIYALFCVAGVGWAGINVNSYPMVVELSRSSNVGKYTGYYYTASMAAQTLTPILSGFLMDIRFTVLFPYAAIFVILSFVTMLFVRHGDAKAIPEKAR